TTPIRRLRAICILTFAIVCLTMTAAAQGQRVRVLNNRSPIVASDLLTPVTYVDAGAELIRVSEQGNWVEVVLPGLNPRRETGFIARANLTGGIPAPRTAAPPPATPESPAAPQRPIPAPEPVRRPPAT